MNDSQRLKKLRKRKNLTLHQLAAKIGVVASTIWKLEHPELADQVSVEIKEKIADVLGTTFYNLFKTDVKKLLKEKQRIEEIIEGE